MIIPITSEEICGQTFSVVEGSRFRETEEKEVQKYRDLFESVGLTLEKDDYCYQHYSLCSISKKGTDHVICFYRMMQVKDFSDLEEIKSNPNKYDLDTEIKNLLIKHIKYYKETLIIQELADIRKDFN